MKKVAGFLVGFLVIFGVIGSANALTWDWTDGNDVVHTYTLIENSGVTWDAAQAAVTALDTGAYLGTITSADEQAAMVTGMGDKASEYWLGGFQTQDEGDWKWETGENFCYTCWIYEVGALFDPYDENCSPVPEPATMMLFGIGLLGLAGVSRRKK